MIGFGKAIGFELLLSKSRLKKFRTKTVKAVTRLIYVTKSKVKYI